MKLFSRTMKFFSHNETNQICKRAEKHCAKPFLTKRKGTQVSYQYLRSNMVGVAGFEPAASWTRTKRDTKLRHTPIDLYIIMRKV